MLLHYSDILPVTSYMGWDRVHWCLHTNAAGAGATVMTGVGGAWSALGQVSMCRDIGDCAGG